MSSVLPEPKFPFVSTIVTVDPEAARPMRWIVGQPHPLIPELKVMRMYIGETDVEIYSMADGGGKNGMRNTVPKFCVRMTEEIMPYEIFVSEIEQAEDPEDDDPDRSEDEAPESSPMPATP